MRRIPHFASLLLFAAVGLAGCQSMGMREARAPGPSSGAMSASTATLRASLRGESEVPPVPGSATGQAEAQLDTTTGDLRYRVTYSGLSGPAMAAHIHGPAAPGSNAGVVVPFSNVGTSPITGTAKLTPAQVKDFMAGMYYVNVHTAAHPGGEIRGQLMPAR